ncbi:MAG: porin [Gammaproteobacteria bacterium]
MNKLKTTALSAALVAMSAPAIAEEASWGISGWINQSMTYFDDGDTSDIVNSGDNGTTLGSRITLSGSTPLAGTGLSAGFEVIVEPTSFGAGDPLTTANQDVFESSNDFGKSINLLSNNLHISGGFGKLTFGTQSMPTDNIAVLADPSLTLWSSISPIFRGNAFQIQDTAAGTTWGSFLHCLATPGLGIGIDCNGVYRNGVRYDLPAFGPVSVAVGYANDDIFDIAVKYSGTIGGMTANVHGGYAYNADGGINTGAAVLGNGSETWQIQAGLMDPNSGLFGSIAYQAEETEDSVAGNNGDDTDAWWLKVGIKKNWVGYGDTAISVNYGQYNDQYGNLGTTAGVTGSEVERFGVSVDQYFGSNLIIYALYRSLELDVSGTNAFDGADDLDTFTLGFTYFF